MSIQVRRAAVGAVAATLLLAGTAVPAFADTGTRAGGFVASSQTDAAEYVLDVDGQSVDLGEGDSASFGMVADSPTPAFGTGVRPNATYTSDCGTLTVTASSGVFYWKINMTCPATSFAGTFSISDRNSGFSGGLVPASAFSGSASTSRYHGHTYSGTLNGTAFLLGVPVAHTVANNTAYKYP